MFTCPICSAVLVEKETEAVCSFCGNKEETEYLCPNNHYVCEDCRTATQTEIIERVCKSTKSTDPIELANLIMKHASFNQYGAEHHVLVAPIILTTLNNLGYTSISNAKINAAIKRGNKIPYGSCGTMGVCGACVSAGITVSMITGANYLKDKERNLTLTTTAKALQAITELGGPRCCKYSVYESIKTAWNVLKTDLDFHLPDLQIKCEFQGKLNDCHLEKCKYYEKQS